MRHLAAGLLLTGALAIAADIPQEGLKAEMAGNWNGAAAIYEKVLKSEPSRIDLYVRLSDIYAKERSYDKAADALSRAIRLEPDNADLYSRLGSVYAVMNQPENALKARTKSVELAPENLSYLIAQARIANWLKRSDIATESLKKAIALDPVNPELLLLVSESSEWAQKELDAIHFYQRYLEQKPDNIHVWLVVADLQLANGDLAGSNETLQKAYARFIKTPKSPPVSPLSASQMTVPILEYHCIDESAPNMYWVSRSEFEAQMDLLVQNGYHSMSVDALVQTLKEGKNLPEKTVAITFDDGCQNLYTQAFPILKTRGLNAQIYVISDSIGADAASRKTSLTEKVGENGETTRTAYLIWPEIKELSDAGWGIGSHTKNHPYMNEADAAVRTNELLFSKLAIYANTQTDPSGFSYPYGAGIGDKTIKQGVADTGYGYAVASSGGVARLDKADPMSIPRVLIYGPNPNIDPQSKGITASVNPARPTDAFMSLVEPNEAENHYQHAEYNVEAQQYAQALEGINKAVALSPETVRYLVAKQEIAASANDPETAADAASRIYAMEPTDERLLELARLNVWANRLDESRDQFIQYLRRHPTEKEIWIEYIQVQSWIGDYPDALRNLDAYAAAYGEDTPSLTTKAGVLAWGNRPNQAFEILNSQLQNNPNDYDANYLNTVALDKNRQYAEAIDSLEKVEKIRPEATKENTFLRKYITTKFRPSVSAGFEYYDDSYDISTRSIPLEGRYAVSPVTALSVNIQNTNLTAKANTGYEQDDGDTSAEYHSATVGIAHQLSTEVALRAAAGGAKAEEDDAFVYSGGLLWTPADTFSIDLSYAHDYFLISPRTVGRGIKDNALQSIFHWEPSMSLAVDMTLRQEWLSDNNERWEIDLAPKWLVSRTQYWNFDMGPTVRLYGFSDQVQDHGYYAPKLIQGYYVTGYLYWKRNENDGVSMTFSGGALHDSYASSTRASGSAALEGTFGFYEDWMLKGNVSLDYTPRFDDQSYRGTAFAVYVTRRF